MGTVVLGKVESGTVSKGQTLTLMPNKVSCVFCDGFMYLQSNICSKYKYIELTGINGRCKLKIYIYTLRMCGKDGQVL